jgi:integrase
VGDLVLVPEFDRQVEQACVASKVPTSLRKFVVESIAESTWRGYASAWRRFVLGGHRATAMGVVKHVQELASDPRRKRPLSAVLKFRAALAFVCDVLNEESPFDDRLVKRIAEGIVRRNTSDFVVSAPVLDVARVLRLLRSATADEGVCQQHAAVAIASVVPSRPAELANLRKEYVDFEFQPSDLGVRAPIVPFDDVPVFAACLEKRPKIGEAFPGFKVNILVVDSKADKKASGKKGVRKIMVHPEWASFSPALVLLCWAAEAHRRVESPFVLDSSGANKISVAYLAKMLSAFSLSATGVAVSSKYWRPAAATWLLMAGIQIDVVAMLGGWASTESIRKHYARAAFWPQQTAAAVAGCSLEASVPAPSTPQRAAVPLTPASSSSRVVQDGQLRFGLVNPSSPARRTMLPLWNGLSPISRAEQKRRNEEFAKRLVSSRGTTPPPPSPWRKDPEAQRVRAEIEIRKIEKEQIQARRPFHRPDPTRAALPERSLRSSNRRTHEGVPSSKSSSKGDSTLPAL